MHRTCVVGGALALTVITLVFFFFVGEGAPRGVNKRFLSDRDVFILQAAEKEQMSLTFHRKAVLKKLSTSELGKDNFGFDGGFAPSTDINALHSEATDSDPSLPLACPRVRWIDRFVTAGNDNKNLHRCFHVIRDWF